MGGGEQVCGRPPPSGKLGNFTNFKTFFPVVSLASPCQKLKKKKKTKQKNVSILKEVHFWPAPSSIGHYREPANTSSPPPAAFKVKYAGV